MITKVSITLYNIAIFFKGKQLKNIEYKQKVLFYNSCHLRRVWVRIVFLDIVALTRQLVNNVNDIIYLYISGYPHPLSGNCETGATNKKYQNISEYTRKSSNYCPYHTLSNVSSLFPNVKVLS